MSEFLNLKQEIKEINILLGQKSFQLSIKNLKDRIEKLEKGSEDDTSNKDLDLIGQFLGKNNKDNAGI